MRGQAPTKGRGEGRCYGAVSAHGGSYGSEVRAVGTAFSSPMTKITQLWCQVTPPHGRGLAGIICRGNWSGRRDGCGLMRGPSRRAPVSRDDGLRGRSFCGDAARSKGQMGVSGLGEVVTGGKGSVDGVVVIIQIRGGCPQGAPSLGLSRRLPTSVASGSSSIH